MRLLLTVFGSSLTIGYVFYAIGYSCGWHDCVRVRLK